MIAKQSKQKDIERKGVRYSVLLQLPYFDAPRMCIIDPMHNLLLGSAKHMIDVWKKLGILESKHFKIIKERIEEFVSPGNSGRQPTSNKILSGFSGFTADQWKTWTLHYSLFCLKDILPFRHYQCWQKFVKACYFICRRTIFLSIVEEADSLLLSFCQTFVQLYGKENCTPNMHLHCHLKECILDYGPVYAFWLFRFECLNGIMGSYHTNCHDISVQLTRRFLGSVQYAPINWPKDIASEFLPLIEQFCYNEGSLRQTNLVTSISDIIPLPPIQEKSFTPEMLRLVQHTFDTCYGESKFKCLLLYKCTDGLKIGDYAIGSCGPRYRNSSMVFALKGSTLSLAMVEFYAKFSALSTNKKETNTEWLAAVSWLTEHPFCLWYGNPIEVWCSTSDCFEFIPICKIKCRVIYIKASVHFGNQAGTDTVIIASPLELK